MQERQEQCVVQKTVVELPHSVEEVRPLPQLQFHQYSERQLQFPEEPELPQVRKSVSLEVRNNYLSHKTNHERRSAVAPRHEP